MHANKVIPVESMCSNYSNSDDCISGVPSSVGVYVQALDSVGVREAKLGYQSVS